MSSTRHLKKRANEISFIQSKRYSNFFEFGHLFTIGLSTISVITGRVVEFLNPLFQFVAAPILVLMSILEVAAAWHQASKAKQGYAFVRATMVTVSAAIVVLAAAMVITGCTVALFLAPLLIATAFAMRSMFELCSAVYLTVKGLGAVSDARASYFKRAAESLLSGLGYGLMAAAVGMITIFIAMSAGLPQLSLAAVIASDVTILSTLLGAACVTSLLFCFLRAGALGQAEGIARADDSTPVWVSSTAVAGSAIGLSARIPSPISSPTNAVITTDQAINTSTNEEAPSLNSPSAAHFDRCHKI